MNSFVRERLKILAIHHSLSTSGIVRRFTCFGSLLKIITAEYKLMRLVVLSTRSSSKTGWLETGWRFETPHSWYNLPDLLPPVAVRLEDSLLFHCSAANRTVITVHVRYFVVKYGIRSKHVYRTLFYGNFLLLSFRVVFIVSLVPYGFLKSYDCDNARNQIIYHVQVFCCHNYWLTFNPWSVVLSRGKLAGATPYHTILALFVSVSVLFAKYRKYNISGHIST